jgi:hypothetical protein
MLGRCRRRVLVCDLGLPRNRRSRALHGYLTRDGIEPPAFNELGRRELPSYGIEFRTIGVTGAEWADDHYRIAFSGGGQTAGRYLLIATGVADDLPAITGLDECYGRSVFPVPIATDGNGAIVVWRRWVRAHTWPAWHWRCEPGAPTLWCAPTGRAWIAGVEIVWRGTRWRSGPTRSPGSSTTTDL